MKRFKDYILLNEWKANNNNKSQIMAIPKNKDELREIIVQRLNANIYNPDFTGIDTSKIKSMSNLFDNSEDDILREKYKINLCDTVCIDISSWDTSNVDTMEWMFANCENVERIIVNGLNTSNVERMNGMFYHCRNILELDLSTFNVSKVNNMNYMFSECEYLNTIKGISNWNVSNASFNDNMHWMFYKVDKNYIRPKWYDENKWEHKS